MTISEQELIAREKDPSMHLFPLHPRKKQPVITVSEDTGVYAIWGITKGGRISAIPVENDKILCKDISQAIKDSYPKKLYPNLKSYLAFGVSKAAVLSRQILPISIFIFGVIGYEIERQDVDLLYKSLKMYVEAVASDDTFGMEYISALYQTEPRRSWINAAIEDIKKKRNWAEFVNRTFEEKMSSLGYQREESET